MSNRLVHCIDHRVYAVSPGDSPLCPLCDQPIRAGDRFNLQTVALGPGEADLLRLVHTECVEDEDEDEDGDVT